ncbi:hypothetical protein WJX81_008561 [Elliptochloris bilobata]|uniref:Uncharacterized protein n=1 Tax=Elliptochloris bilobata TaxID=381761 RepID=A0AAW1RNS7_9CHLO
MASGDDPECTIFCLDDSECAFRSEDFLPSRWAYQREAASLLLAGARLRGAAGPPTPLGTWRGLSAGTARFAFVLAGGAPRVLAPPGQAADAALAALSEVKPAEGGGGFLSGLRLAALLARRCGRGGGGRGRGGALAERLCYVLVYRLDLPKWRVLAEVRAGRMLPVVSEAAAAAAPDPNPRASAATSPRSHPLTTSAIGSARRSSAGPVRLRADMRPGVLRLVQATDGSGRMRIQWISREEGSLQAAASLPALQPAPPAASESSAGAPAGGQTAAEAGTQSPTAQPLPLPETAAAPSQPELEVTLVPDRVRFSAAPHTARVLVVEQAVEAGERRRRDKHRGCIATRVGAHSRQRVECWFFWLQQAWPVTLAAAAAPSAATGEAGLAAALAALVAAPPPYDVERARREARARCSAQPVTLGPLPTALVEEVLLGAGGGLRASPAASAALAAAAAALASSGGPALSSLTSSALARHIREAAAGGGGVSPLGGQADRRLGRSGSPGGNARRRMYRALHAARRNVGKGAGVCVDDGRRQPTMLGRSHSSPGDLDNSRRDARPRSPTGFDSQAGAPTDAGSCELLGEAHCGREGNPGRILSPSIDPSIDSTLDPSMSAEEIQAEACSVHAARRAVLEGGGPLGGGSGRGAVVSGGGGAAPALGGDARKDSQPDDLSLFEVD